MPDPAIPPAVQQLPALNAILNTTSTLLLLAGYRFIRRGRISAHRRAMLSAIATSGLFLVSYVIYHYFVGSVPYPRRDWSRPLYFAILIPHIILAPTMLPFIAAAVWHALRGNVEKHRRLVRWVWPVWIFVSLTGVVIYLMLYRL